MYSVEYRYRISIVLEYNISSFSMWQIKGFPKRHAQNHEETLIEIKFSWSVGEEFHLSEDEEFTFRVVSTNNTVLQTKKKVGKKWIESG